MLVRPELGYSSKELPCVFRNMDSQFVEQLEEGLVLGSHKLFVGERDQWHRLFLHCKRME